MSLPETTPSRTAAAATPRTASRREYDCLSPIRFLFGLTTYYSRLACLVAGTQTQFLVSRSPLGSHAKPRRSARDSRPAAYLVKSRIQESHKRVAEELRWRRDSSETLWTARLSFAYPWAAKPHRTMRGRGKSAAPFSANLPRNFRIVMSLALTYSCRDCSEVFRNHLTARCTGGLWVTKALPIITSEPRAQAQLWATCSHTGGGLSTLQTSASIWWLASLGR